MKNSNVTQFVRDEQFYFMVGRERLLAGDFLSALRYMALAKKAIKPQEHILGASNNLIIGQIYALLEEYDLSNYYLFSSLSNQFLSQPAYRSLAENFLSLGNKKLGKYYLEKCIEISNSTHNAYIAKELLKEISKLEEPKHHGFTVIEGSKNGNKESILNQIDNLMINQNYEEVISLCNSSQNLDDKDIRSALSNAYLETNKFQEGLNLIKTYGTQNLDDLSSLLLIYNALGDKENYAFVLAQLKNYVPKNEEECFKLGTVLASCGEQGQAIAYLDKYFAKAEFDYDLLLTYCQICMNAKFYEKAKQKLIELKIYNPFDSYLINKYLEICEKKGEYNFTNANGYSAKEVLDIKTQIKNYLVLDEKKLKDAFAKNEDFFYFVSKFNDGSLKNLLLLRLSKINSKPINAFFRCILLKNDAKTPLKLQLLKNRLQLDAITYQEYTKNDIYTTIALPNKKLLKKYNPNLYEATIKCINYLLFNADHITINLRTPIMRLDALNIGDSAKPNLIAAYVLWTSFGNGKIRILKHICETFNVTKEEIYNFANFHKLSIF